jgi:hypothetical protein
MDKITKTDVEAAYKAGVEAGRKAGITLGIEMGIQHCGEIMSAELHRFKFPEGHETRWNYKVDGLRPDDNSTFEFTYETYEERMKKKSAEMREMREREADERRSRRNRWKKNAPSMKKLWKYAPKEAK